MTRKPIEEILTAEEVTLYCRFCIGPKERPTPRQKIRVTEILAKIKAADDEERRKENEFFNRAADAFERVAESETDAEKKRDLLESAARMRGLPL